MLLSGAALGLALGIPSYKFRAEAAAVGSDPETANTLPIRERVVRALVGAGLGFVARVGYILMPATDMTVFYAVELVMSAIYTYLALVYVPVVSNLLFSRKVPDLPEESSGSRTSSPKKKAKKKLQ